MSLRALGKRLRRLLSGDAPEGWPMSLDGQPRAFPRDLGPPIRGAGATQPLQEHPAIQALLAFGEAARRSSFFLTPAPNSQDPARAHLPPPTPAEVTALKSQHPDAGLYQLDFEGLHVVVRLPLRPHVLNHFLFIMGGDRRPEALEWLFRAVVVHPGPEAINEALRLRPGLGDTFGRKVLALEGFGTPGGATRDTPAREDG